MGLSLKHLNHAYQLQERGHHAESDRAVAQSNASPYKCHQIAKTADTSAETFHAMDSRRFALLNYWPIGGHRFWICTESLLDLCFLLLFRTKRLSGLSQLLREPYLFSNFGGMTAKSCRRLPSWMRQTQDENRLFCRIFRQVRNKCSQKVGRRGAEEREKNVNLQ